MKSTGVHFHGGVMTCKRVPVLLAWSVSVYGFLSQLLCCYPKQLLNNEPIWK